MIELLVIDDEWGIPKTDKVFDEAPFQLAAPKNQHLNEKEVDAGSQDSETKKKIEYNVHGLDKFDAVALLDFLEEHKNISVILLDILDAGKEAGIDLFRELSDVTVLENKSKEEKKTIEARQKAWKAFKGKKQVIFFSNEATNYRHYEVSGLKRIEVAGFLDKQDVIEHKPEALERIKQAAQRSQKYAKFPEMANLTQQLLASEGHEVIFSPNSEQMERVLEYVVLAGRCKEPVLIRGETGTGKELVAQQIAKMQAICNGSTNNSSPILSLNIAAIPAEGNLLNSELFGHKKGAFTGATGEKVGLFKKASTENKPIFLDEIGDAPPNVQNALLRVLQDKEFLPVGATQPEKLTDLRLITASNTDFEAKIAQGEYRLDLYHRLCGIEIELPPLRQRLHDIPLLVQRFLHDFNTQNDRKIIPDETEAKEIFRQLQQYDWPGNIRELEQAIRSSCALLWNDKFELAKHVQDKLNKHKKRVHQNSSTVVSQQREDFWFGTYSDAQLSDALDFLENLSANDPKKVAKFRDFIGLRYFEKLADYCRIKDRALTGKNGIIKGATANQHKSVGNWLKEIGNRRKELGILDEPNSNEL